MKHTFSFISRCTLTFLLAALLLATVGFALDSYVIEFAHDDTTFFINDEKYEAQTYCLGWKQGDRVVFLEGSPYGACATAVLYNLRLKESCDVWCE